MAQRFYAPRDYHWLTVSDKEGRLTEIDLAWNIMRMMVMSEEGVNAAEALRILDEMAMPEFNKLKDQAYKELYDPAMQAYLERNQIRVGQLLRPVEDEEELLSYLDGMNWGNMVAAEIPESEWE